MSMIETMAAKENISVDDGDDIIQLLQQEGQASEQEQQQEERPRLREERQKEACRRGREEGVSESE